MCVGRLDRQIIHYCSMFNVTLMCVLSERVFLSFRLQNNVLVSNPQINAMLSRKTPESLKFL